MSDWVIYTIVGTLFGVVFALGQYQEMRKHPIKRCGAKPAHDSIMRCNLPKGHACDHQDVSKKGDGGCVGWHNVERYGEKANA